MHLHVFFAALYKKMDLTIIRFVLFIIQTQNLILHIFAYFVAIEIVQDVSTKFSQLTGTAGTAINKKLQTALKNNKGFQIVCEISKILTGEEENVGLDIPEDLTSSDMAYFKFAPITSADVERSFSLYKNILAPNRRSFKFENIKKSLIVQCNNYFKGLVHNEDQD